VLDIMIHDLDVVLALANSSVTGVQALGISVLGGHEDMATARLTFDSGCIAQLTASRVSPQQRRTMNIFTSRGSASIDFASHEATLIKPREDVLRRKFRLDRLSAAERAHLKDHLFDELLIRTEHEAAKVNAIQEEQRDFVTSIRTGKTPRVDGAAGRDAIAVAEMILAKIEQHAWDGNSAGRHGPFAMPALPIITAPARWQEGAKQRRRAG
jgi:predicted dehydrogenase